MAKVDPSQYDKTIADIRAKRISVPEAARHLGVSENSVRKQLNRAKLGKRRPPPALPVAPLVRTDPVTESPEHNPADGGLEGFKAAVTEAPAGPAAGSPAQAAAEAAETLRQRHAATSSMAIGLLQLATGLVCRGYAWFSKITISNEEMAKLVDITPTERKILEDAAIPAMPYIDRYLQGSEEGALGLFLGQWGNQLAGRLQTLSGAKHAGA